MELVDALDRGAALAPEAPCLVKDDDVLSYAEVQGLSRSVAASLEACGVRAGEDRVGVLSANDPLVLSCVFGASREGAAWVVVDPGEVTSVEKALRVLGDCTVLLFRAADATLVTRLRDGLARLHTAVCLDGVIAGALSWGQFLVAGLSRGYAPIPDPPEVAPLPPAQRPVFVAAAPLAEVTAECGEVLAVGGTIHLGRQAARERVGVQA